MASPWFLADQQRRRAAQAEELARLTQPSGLAGQSFGYAQQNNPIPNEQSIYDKFVQENQVTPPARAVPDPPNVQAARKAVASYGVPWKEAAETGAHAMQQVFEPVSGAVMGVQGKIEGNQQKIDAAKRSLFMGGEGPIASDLAMHRTAGAVDLDPNEPAASRAAKAAIKTPWEALPLVIGPGELLSGGKLLAKPTNAMARKVHQSILSRAKEAGRGETFYSLGPLDAARLQEIKEQLPKFAPGSNDYKNLKAEQKALSQKSIADDLEQASMERTSRRTEEIGPEKYVSDMKIGGGEDATAGLTRPDPIRKRSGRVTGGSDDAQKIIARIDQLTTEGKFKREYKNAIGEAINKLGLEEGDPVLVDLRARHAAYPANKGEAKLFEARRLKAEAAKVEEVLAKKGLELPPDPEAEAAFHEYNRQAEEIISKLPEEDGGIGLQPIMREPSIEGSADLTPAPLPPREPGSKEIEELIRRRFSEETKQFPIGKDISQVKAEAEEARGIAKDNQVQKEVRNWTPSNSEEYAGDEIERALLRGASIDEAMALGGKAKHSIHGANLDAIEKWWKNFSADPYYYGQRSPRISHINLPEEKALYEKWLKDKLRAQQAPREILRPETKAQVQAAAEQVGNPEYGEKVLAKAEELAGPAQQQTSLVAQPSTAVTTTGSTQVGPHVYQTSGTRNVPPPGAGGSAGGGRSASPGSPPAGPPRMPSSQQPIGSAPPGKWPLIARWWRNIQERIRTGGLRSRAEADKPVVITDRLTGQNRRVPFKEVVRDADQAVRRASEEASLDFGRAAETVYPATSKLRADPALHDELRGPVKYTVPNVPQWVDSRFNAMRDGERIKPRTPDEAMIADAYQVGIIQQPGMKAQDHGLSRMMSDGTIKPIKPADRTLGIHSLDESLIDLMKNRPDSEEAKYIAKIITDGNNALGSPITYQGVEETLRGVAPRAEKTTALEFQRSIDHLPTWVEMPDGRMQPVLKANLIKMPTDKFPGIFASEASGQSKAMSWKIHVGQDFGPEAAQAVKDFRAAHPNHPVPISKLLEYQQGFQNAGREADLDRLTAAYFGQAQTKEGQAVGAFIQGRQGGTHITEGRRALDTAYESMLEGALTEVGPKQITQTLRELPQLFGLRNTISGLRHAFNSSRSAEAGRIIDQFESAAIAIERPIESWVRKVTGLVRRNVTNFTGQMNENIATATGAAAFDRWSEAARRGKLGITDIRKLADDLNMSDQYIADLGTAQPGTPRYFEMRRIMQDVAGRTQFTNTPKQLQGIFNVDPLVSGAVPLNKYLAGTFRETWKLFREFGDAVRPGTNLGLTDRAKLLADAVKRSGYKVGGASTDAAWLAAYTYAANYAWNKMKDDLGLGAPARKPSWNSKEPSTAEHVLGTLAAAQALGPWFGALNRIGGGEDMLSEMMGFDTPEHKGVRTADELGAALINTSYPASMALRIVGKPLVAAGQAIFGDKAEKPGWNSKVGFLQKWLINDLSMLVPGPGGRKLVADFYVLANLIHDELAEKKPEPAKQSPLPVMKPRSPAPQPVEQPRSQSQPRKPTEERLKEIQERVKGRMKERRPIGAAP